MMMFTDSEDDSVESGDEELNDNERRLVQVFWRTRNWIVLQNQGLFKLLMKQSQSCAVVFTPISPDDQVRTDDRSVRFVSIETKLSAIFDKLKLGMNMIEGTQPLMM